MKIVDLIPKPTDGMPDDAARKVLEIIRDGKCHQIEKVHSASGILREVRIDGATIWSQCHVD